MFTDFKEKKFGDTVLYRLSPMNVLHFWDYRFYLFSEKYRVPYRNWGEIEARRKPGGRRTVYQDEGWKDQLKSAMGVLKLNEKNFLRLGIAVYLHFQYLFFKSTPDRYEISTLSGGPGRERPSFCLQKAILCHFFRSHVFYSTRSSDKRAIQQSSDIVEDKSC